MYILRHVSKMRFFFYFRYYILFNTEDAKQYLSFCGFTYLHIILIFNDVQRQSVISDMKIQYRMSSLEYMGRCSYLFMYFLFQLAL